MIPPPPTAASSLTDHQYAHLLGGSDLPRAPPSRMRWFVLSLTCTVLVGCWFAYDQVAALNIPLETYLHLTTPAEYQYLIGSFYIVYSLPNIILPFVGGVLIDKYGPRTIAVLFSLLVVAGQLIFVTGLVDRTPGWAIFGRFVFGLGGETLSVAQQHITTKWFRGTELALAVGINLSIARVGSVINDIVSPYLAHRYSIPLSLWFGFATCIISLAGTLVLVIIDQRYSHLADASSIAPDAIGLTSRKHGTTRRTTRPRAVSPTPAVPHGSSVWSLFKRELWQVRRGIRHFPRAFWVIQVVMVLLYGTVVPFNTIHSAFLAAKWYPGDAERAAQVMGVPDTLSAVLVPFAGSFFDRVGFRAHAIVVCGAMIGMCHFVLGSVPASVMTSPVPVLMVLGSSYALLLTFVPCIPLLVPPGFLGTAYGINNSIANMAWGLFPVLVAALATNDPTYYQTEMFFALCGFLSIVVGLYVVKLDARDHDGILRKPAVAAGASKPHADDWDAVPVLDSDEDSDEDEDVEVGTSRAATTEARAAMVTPTAGASRKVKGGEEAGLAARASEDEWDKWSE
ncbi:hypothetical protein AMAG_12554 [Allomyces macrogynus ATCC 38327]|uniref:Lysosomal dipeptide transporter MFSD1 n=1 Tax=Allomyces macrogynus (strain ATCC 38327) TaxID=578462 RepID=A0A0L0SZB1_ALLM3|nr:hypothetical protein AMAG_12554 [Allomyces macrogynus ATCC 38327]|eukprot:KNE67836.1 hypothetical protein AMAG_12554 [Allomyces macrogynus ATCC 38327]